MGVGFTLPQGFALPPTAGHVATVLVDMLRRLGWHSTVSP